MGSGEETELLRCMLSKGNISNFTFVFGLGFGILDM